MESPLPTMMIIPRTPNQVMLTTNKISSFATADGDRGRCAIRFK